MATCTCNSGVTYVPFSVAELIYPASNNALFVKNKKLMCLLVSTQEGNYIRYGNDNGAYIDGNDILSNGGAGDYANLLSIDPNDKRLTLTKKTLQEAGFSTSASSSSTSTVAVSTQSGNLLTTGADGGAYLSSATVTSLASSAGQSAASSAVSSALVPSTSVSPNLLKQDSTGHLYVSTQDLIAAGFGTGSGSDLSSITVVSSASGNLISGSASTGAYLSAATVQSAIQSWVENLIDSKINTANINGSTSIDDLISSDSDNALRKGSDGKLYVVLDAGEL